MDQHFFHRLKYRQRRDQLFVRARGVVILYYLLFQSVPGAQPKDSVVKDTQETRTVVLKQEPIPPHPVKAKKDSLPGKTQPQKEKTFPVRTCGTVTEKRKPGHYWLLVTSGFSFLMMLFLIIRDRKPAGRK